MDQEHAKYKANVRNLIENSMTSSLVSMDSTSNLRATDSNFNMATPLYRFSHQPHITNNYRPSTIEFDILSHHEPSSIRNLHLDDECGDHPDVLPLLDGTTNPPARRAETETHLMLNPSHTVQYVKELLPSFESTETGLVNHLRECYTFGAGTQVALGDIVTQCSELDEGTFLEGTEGFGDASDPFHDASCEIYDICRTGKAVSRHDEDGEDRRLEAKEVWSYLRSLNASRNPSTVGRITILAEPSPRVFGAVHYVLRNYFDMDELLGHLVSGIDNNGRTRAYMLRAFKENSVHQRTFFFVFKYYTITGDGASSSSDAGDKGDKIPLPAKSPYVFQQYDRRPAEKKTAYHIDIAEASSVIALSLSGNQTKDVYLKHKRRKPIKGTSYSAFSPWQVLLLQAFPDDEHTTRDHSAPQSYSCGPLAFLDLLASEYRDAGKRLNRLMRRITKLITPPLTFIFDYKLRDGLLFEDAHYTYSRRYFWAYNTLGVINDGINDMIHAYYHAFPPKFWSASSSDGFFIPDSVDEKVRSEYIHALGQAKRELDAAVRDLNHIWMANESVRQEIKSLRDQLFSGSSVKESRRVIEQGDNIKLLTILSMVFLPLSFVVSIFGITELHIPPNDWRFPVTMVLVCVPFLLFVLLSQTITGIRLVKRSAKSVKDYFGMLNTGATAVTSVPAPIPPANSVEIMPVAKEKQDMKREGPPKHVKFVGQKSTLDKTGGSLAAPRARFKRRISRRSVNLPHWSVDSRNLAESDLPRPQVPWWKNIVAPFTMMNLLVGSTPRTKSGITSVYQHDNPKNMKGFERDLEMQCSN